jgi:hypothetical protein
VAKHREVLVVGRLIDAFDEEICKFSHAAWTFTQRAENPGRSLDNPGKRDHPWLRCGVSSDGYPMWASLLHLPRARHLLRAEQRLALALLASIPHGVAEGLLVLAHGFDSDVIAALVHIGLAKVRRETIKADGPPIEVVRITITDAGRKALES